MSAAIEELKNAFRNWSIELDKEFNETRMAAALAEVSAKAKAVLAEWHLAPPPALAAEAAAVEVTPADFPKVNDPAA